MRLLGRSHCLGIRRQSHIVDLVAVVAYSHLRPKIYSFSYHWDGFGCLQSLHNKHVPWVEAL